MNQQTIKKEIKVGTKVEFDSDDIPQIGTVIEIKTDLSNGRAIAIIRVPNTLDGVSWHMPVDQLKPAKKRCSS